MARSSLQPIKRERIGNQVFLQLKEQVLRRVWAPGSKLPSENDLATTLGVSRVSIREGLQRLATLGLLETRQGEGTFVRRFSGEIYLNSLLPMLALDRTSVFEVLEYRRVMERGTVGLVVEKAGADDIAAIEASYQEMIKNQDDPHEFAQADLEFHLAIARATHNPIIVKINGIIRNILSESMGKIVLALGNQDGLHYHRRILDALLRRDAGTAERLMEEHIIVTIDRLKTEAVFADD